MHRLMLMLLLAGLVIEGCGSTRRPASTAPSADSPPVASSPVSSPPDRSSTPPRTTVRANTRSSHPTPPAATSENRSAAADPTAPDWDIDGDGRADAVRLVYLGGYGPDNWRLDVDMTSLGRQIVRFTGSPILPGNTAAPTIAGSVDADRDGHAEVFVKVDSGASTQFWTIFRLVGGQIAQVTVKGTPLRLAVGGSVTHQDGFRCLGAKLVTVAEETAPPNYIVWTYQRDTLAWERSALVVVSEQTGQIRSSRVAVPPAAYTGVRCGDLPQYAPGFMAATR